MGFNCRLALSGGEGRTREELEEQYSNSVTDKVAGRTNGPRPPRLEIEPKAM